MSVLNKGIILLIQGYQKVISPMLPGNTCRFYPTCSSYALESFQKYGFIKAFTMSVKRISRCHPLNPGGYDPVP